HGWWTNEGQKISKSLGNVIDPFELIESYGLDPVRFFLLREVPFGNDGDFSRKSFVLRCNADLANGLGNLSQRTLSMIHKNCDGLLPAPGTLTNEDNGLLLSLEGTLEVVRTNMDNQAFHAALDAIFAQSAAADLYISQQEPWKLRKTDPERMNTVLYVLADAIRQLAILIQPIMPQAAEKILNQLNVTERGFDQLGAAGRLKPGTSIPKPEGVFPRLDVPEDDE
ncbi:MAG: methionine--tRNA ligase, partial [Kordiimonadaceae bacterium]|nr:methionine--tRNA ligase [Kordiimonadaceae bacterium]